MDSNFITVSLSYNVVLLQRLYRLDLIFKIIIQKHYTYTVV